MQVLLDVHLNLVPRPLWWPLLIACLRLPVALVFAELSDCLKLYGGLVNINWAFTTTRFDCYLHGRLCQ